MFYYYIGPGQGIKVRYLKLRWGILGINPLCRLLSYQPPKCELHDTEVIRLTIATSNRYQIPQSPKTGPGMLKCLRILLYASDSKYSQFDAGIKPP